MKTGLHTEWIIKDICEDAGSEINKNNTQNKSIK